MTHRSLEFYGNNTKPSLLFYMTLGMMTKLPLIGPTVRKIAEWYGENKHGAYVVTEEEALKIAEKSSSIAVGKCACRETFENCGNPLGTDLVFGIGFDVFREISPDEYREIGTKEAKRIISECSDAGLVQAVMECERDLYAICNCCTCCCVPLRLFKDYEIGSAWKEKPDDLIERIPDAQ